MKVVTQERVALTLSSEQLAELDEWRRLQADLPSRAEAIRRLIGQGVTPKDTA